MDDDEVDDDIDGATGVGAVVGGGGGGGGGWLYGAPLAQRPFLLSGSFYLTGLGG
jgi:hypothetical protein